MSAHLPATGNAPADTRKLLSTLWTRNLPMIRDRLDLLDRAAETAHNATLTSLLRSDAAMTAHKLAGSLGMFGYTEGTELARRLELILDHPSSPDPTLIAELAAQLRRSLAL